MIDRVDPYPQKVLGCFEQELDDAVERAIAWEPSTVVNVRSAGGFYVLGLARRLPASRLVAIEPSEPAGDALTALLDAAGLPERCLIFPEFASPEVGGRARLPQPRHQRLRRRGEGASGPAAVPGLRSARLIVEKQTSSSGRRPTR
ncbi:hypothetical protein GKE82_18550 [Conexibacter sp. W3-3-2]|uniref:hypothetical protein n=1 Tax=Conexibacter sp. W3-3-2 TaxID=2675227 RepID=UPI0012B9E86A|nr:hypothetical protein [Conexibacter sp. W3-3-2]MTD46233.1 hypothetical protein [Conexibacter sp. W3-3-2]